MIGYGYIYGGRYVSSEAASYLVDTYSIELAYSLRKVSSTATNTIRVRRTSDNAEQDIGFSGNDLDTASLTSFCSGTDGYVAKWYNQGTGGSTYDGNMSVAANQPKIVTSGAVELSTNGQPALWGDGSTDQLDFTNAWTSSIDATYLMVFDRSTSGIYSAPFGVSFGPLLWNTSNILSSRLTASTTHETGRTETGSFLFSVISNSSNNVYMRQNGSNLTTASYTVATFTITASQNAIMQQSGVKHSGYIQEILIIKTDETSNLSSIESDINGYYSIY